MGSAVVQWQLKIINPRHHRTGPKGTRHVHKWAAQPPTAHRPPQSPQLTRGPYDQPKGAGLSLVYCWVSLVCGHKLKMGTYCMTATLRGGPERQGRGRESSQWESCVPGNLLFGGEAAKRETSEFLSKGQWSVLLLPGPRREGLEG